MVSTLQLQHLRNLNHLEADYKQEYDQVIAGDLCTQNLDYFQQQADCEQFISGIPMQGMGLTLISYIRSTRLSLSNSQSIAVNYTVNSTFIRDYTNSLEAFQVYIVQHEFVQTFMRRLVTTLK